MGLVEWSPTKTARRVPRSPIPKRAKKKVSWVLLIPSIETSVPVLSTVSYYFPPFFFSKYSTTLAPLLSPFPSSSTSFLLLLLLLLLLLSFGHV
jgi:hypothetical protein